MKHSPSKPNPRQDVIFFHDRSESSRELLSSLTSNGYSVSERIACSPAPFAVYAGYQLRGFMRINTFFCLK
jgi:hypothetical protein